MKEKQKKAQKTKRKNSSDCRATAMEERKEVFNEGSYADILGTILGCEPQVTENTISKSTCYVPEHCSHLYSLKEAYGINKNMLFFGATRSEKTNCYVVPMIMQILRREESAVVMDTSGEVYGITANMARVHGYTVKVLNLNPQQLIHSDSCDYMSVIGEDILSAQLFSDIVLHNMKIENFPIKDSLLSCYISSLLSFAVLYVNHTEGLEYEKTLGGVFKYLNTHTVDAICIEGAMLDDVHPAKTAYIRFRSSDTDITTNALALLLKQLQPLRLSNVQKITGIPDIDITLPGREKCLYFINTCDYDNYMQLYATLHLTLTYRKLLECADLQPNGCLPVRVNMVLDEFASCDNVPFFDSIISTCKGRKIDTFMFMQGIEQLKTMFPDDKWRTIIACCSTKVVAGGSSLATAEYFSELENHQAMEEHTCCKRKCKGKEEKSAVVIDDYRNICTLNKIIHLNPKNALVYVAFHSPAEVEMVYYMTHPMCKEIRKCSIFTHTPKWLRDISDEEWNKLNIKKTDIFEEEGYLPIELCTREDFESPWSIEKQDALDRQIKEDMALYMSACKENTDN